MGTSGKLVFFCVAAVRLWSVCECVTMWLVRHSIASLQLCPLDQLQATSSRLEAQLAREVGRLRAKFERASGDLCRSHFLDTSSPTKRRKFESVQSSSVAHATWPSGQTLCGILKNKCASCQTTECRGNTRRPRRQRLPCSLCKRCPT